MAARASNQQYGELRQSVTASERHSVRASQRQSVTASETRRSQRARSSQMAPPRHRIKSHKLDVAFGFLKRPVRLVRNLLLDPTYFWHTAALLLAAELVLNLLIVRFVAYTEIDWVAYMEEVSGFLHGERDYTKLAGDTGPLVYPAGFLYVYSLLYHLTDSGRNIRLAQYIFAVLYIGTQAVVFAIYSKSKQIPPYALILLTLSKRLHSIYVLRCFNDPVAMFFFYVCTLAAVHHRWTVACVFYR
ncbi:ALG3 protein-domain-containing protein [Jimgerdemannia flammicorona]|uniref:Dol-P-Man:Man(5)GlcNAc(2)-PP-Dol alpha-1,3-mannosyltransferase n=1 Tax=Jimgerdemannia flammicorona TaxID=994334 RepID=A0A433QKQ2_9FUNG|nr:ALG3 protein-domain-containing protein [Jimgerdemannia flammicorona]